MAAETNERDLGVRKHPNVLLIVLDTLRADRLHSYGYPKPTSPFLDRLAEQGTVYLNAIAPDVWTLPVHASLFTGTFTSTHQTHRQNRWLRADLRTLAEVLRDLGYRTAGISNNAWVSSLTGLDRGFDAFFLGGRIFKPSRLSGRFVRDGARSYLTYVLNKAYRGAFRLRYGDGGPWIAQKALAWLSGSEATKPFFLFLNYKECHLRYTPRKTYAQMFLDPGPSASDHRHVNQDAFAYMAGRARMTEDDFRLLGALYDGELRFLDDCLAELFGVLRARGYLDDSLIIITSDHGENLGEHGLMDHQYCVYDTLARVPLIVVRPGDFEQNATHSAQVQVHDIFPTVLDCAGANGEAHRQSEAISLFERREVDEAIIEYTAPATDVMQRRFPGMDLTPFARTFRAYRTSRYKFIQASDGRHELYDLAADQGETNNLVDALPAVSADLQRKLEAWAAKRIPSPPPDSDKAEYDQDIIDRLTQLGYL